MVTYSENLGLNKQSTKTSPASKQKYRQYLWLVFTRPSLALHILKMAIKCLICFFSSVLSRSLSQFYSCRSCQRMSLYLALLGVWLLSLRLSWRTESHVNHRLRSSSPRVRQATVSHADTIALPRRFYPSNQLLSWGEWNPNHFFSKEHACVTPTIHFFYSW